jgi:hypothetical protein
MLNLFQHLFFNALNMHYFNTSKNKNKNKQENYDKYRFNYK